MQPNGNVIVDTICRTAKLGTTITGATENGDVTVIEAEPAGSLEYSATTSSAAWSICPSSATQQLHVRLPRYRCTNKRCLQKIFRAGLACAPDNSKTTDQVTHWILQRLCLNRMSVAAAPKSLGLGWDMKCPRFCSV